MLDTGYWILDTRRNHSVFNLRLFALCFILCIIVAGCSDEYPFDPQDSAPVVHAGSLSALNFPTADGSSWEYISIDGEHTYTTKVTGTRYISGFTTKGMESDSEIPVSDLAWLYQLYQLYGFPVRTSFFTKDLDSYTEHAIEFWVDFLDETYYQKVLPKRVLWSFPLEVGKEWTVLKSYGVPEVTYTRKVVPADSIINIPAGTFRNVFYVEEYVSIANAPNDEQIPGKYWLAPDVGVIKYEYVDLISGVTVTYELSKFSKGN